MLKLLLLISVLDGLGNDDYKIREKSSDILLKLIKSEPNYLQIIMSS